MSNTNNTMPSAKELELYQKGELSPERTAEIKAQAATNPLVAEALEGFAIFPAAFGAIPGVESFLSAGAQASATSAAASAGTAATNSMLQTAASWLGAKSIIIAGVTATVAITGTLVVVNELRENKTAEQQQVSPIINSERQEENAGNQNGAEETSTSVAGTQDNSTGENASQPQATASYIPSGPGMRSSNSNSNTDVDNIQSLVSFASDETNNPIPGENGAAQDPEVIAAITDSAQGHNTTNVTDASSDKKVLVGIEIVRKYKVADYTKMINNQSWKSFDADPGGVPAAYENEEQKLAAEKEKAITKDIPYMQYMSLCLEAMDMKEYALAVSHFNTILEQYPQDVNAQFYSAHSYFRSGQYEKAIALYDITMQNMISTFDEEAEFYKAKSLKALGREEEANKMFTDIAARGKYYASQAARELE